MLWFVGSMVVVLWLVLRFIFHKSGMIHICLMIAASIFLIQFVQDRRTKAYQRSLTR